jgi:hypothetical protein
MMLDGTLLEGIVPLVDGLRERLESGVDVPVIRSLFRSPFASTPRKSQMLRKANGQSCRSDAIHSKASENWAYVTPRLARRRQRTASSSIAATRDISGTHTRVW